MTTAIILAVAILLMAALYSSVGHAGASGYLTKESAPAQLEHVKWHQGHRPSAGRRSPSNTA